MQEEDTDQAETDPENGHRPLVPGEAPQGQFFVRPRRQGEVQDIAGGQHRDHQSSGDQINQQVVKKPLHWA
jgi:hypothetical protein